MRILDEQLCAELSLPPAAAPPNCDIDILSIEIDWVARRQKRDLDLGVQLHEPFEARGQPSRGDGWRGIHANHRRRCRIGEPAAGPAKGNESLLDDVGKYRPFTRQLDAPRQPAKEAGVQEVFEVANLLADSRRRDAKLNRGEPEASMACGRVE